MSMIVAVKLDEGAYMPEKAHDADAGFDIRIPCDRFIGSLGSLDVDTGVHIAIPRGYVGFLKSKSGLNVNDGIVGEGVIDSGYTGSIRVKLYNNSNNVKKFYKGDKIIQLVILPIPEVELFEVTHLPESDRGDKGFGSSGR